MAPPDEPSRLPWLYEEILLATDLTASNGWAGVRATDPRAAELSAALRNAHLHPNELRTAKFRSPASIQRKTFDIATQHPAYAGKPTMGSRLDQQVLARWLADPERLTAEAAAVREALEAGEEPLSYDTLGEEPSAPEGRLLLSRHVRRERSQGLRAAKIAAAAEGQALDCEVCGFNFSRRYGPRGSGYIEVHHRLPLHVSGETETTLPDLALLCANCHRMCHAGGWVPVDQLRVAVLALAAADDPR